MGKQNKVEILMVRKFTWKGWRDYQKEVEEKLTKKKMAEKSKIQWTDATWNIAVGCTKIDEDCKYCYMYRGSLNNTRYNPKQINKTKTVFNLPLKLKEPSKIFTSSLTDFFHEECDSFRNEAWEIIRKCPQHTFQILTKRPERIKECLPEDWGHGWDNVWLGTSVGSQEAANIRIPELLCVPAKIKFLSIEPLHGEITFFSPELKNTTWFINYSDDGEGGIIKEGELELYFDWVIIGGESGNDTGKYRHRPCKLEWIENIISDCKEAGVPVFIKQLGTHIAKELNLTDRHGGNIDEWPEHLRIREFPNIERKN